MSQTIFHHRHVPGFFGLAAAVILAGAASLGPSHHPYLVDRHH